jgi:tRNA A-37 threonylcarbamoyl transferase component Bud32
MRCSALGKALLSTLALASLASAAPDLSEPVPGAPESLAETAFPPVPSEPTAVVEPADTGTQAAVEPQVAAEVAPGAPPAPEPLPGPQPIVPPGSPSAAPVPAPSSAIPPAAEGSATFQALRHDLRLWARRTSALGPRLREPFAPLERATNRAIADPIGTARAFVAWAQTEDAQLRVLPGAAGALLLLLLLSVLRGWGDAVVAIEYPSELRGSFSVHLSKSQRRARRLPRTGSPGAALRAKRRSRASSRLHRYMVSREAQFESLRAGRWWVTIDGYLQSATGEDVIATHFEERELRVRRGSTQRVDFDFRPKDCPVDVKVMWDRRPVPDALVSLRGVPYSLRYTRGGVVRVGVGRGRHTLVVGSGDRVAEQTVEVASFQPTSLVIDLGSRDHLVFVGCPPAVEPYLHGDVSGAARALERDGHREVSQLLFARLARERGQLDTAAGHLEQAGRVLDAAELRAELSHWKQAAQLFESAGELERAAEMYQAAGEHGRAGESFQRAGLHDEAALSYREAGDLPRWVESLEKSGRPFEAAKIAIERQDWARAIRSLQLVTPADAEYLEAARLLVDAYLRQGHLDLATRKVEEAINAKGVEAIPLDTCDRLARRLEEGGDFERALDLLELIRRHDATWPNVATRIEALRKRRSGSQNALSGAPAAPPALDPFGEAARYEILEELGRGGMGIVFKARDRRLGRVVALKRLPDSLRNHPKAVELFLREARAAAALNHPNIVTLFDAGQDGDTYYITMELLEGLPLGQILRQRGKLVPRDAARLGVQIANGLDYAHAQRIVHRDIKTGNLFFTRGKTVKIMDFGLAKMVEEVRRATTVIGGTPYYMAPEQSLGDAVDHRADLYALGVTFYELLTGRVPFKEGDVAFHHRHTPVPDPRELVPDLPEAWAALVLALMAKDPEARPASAAAVGERLAQLVQAGSR